MPRKGLVAARWSDSPAAMSDTESTVAPPSAQAPGLLQILTSFALISLYGFGGVLAWSRRMMVEERRWMTPEEFNDAYALCQFLPGPNIVNLSVVFGSRVRGVAGAAMALIGLLCPPVAIVSLLGLLYANYGDIAVIGQVLSGVVASAAGLLIATVAKMIAPVLRRWRDPGPAVGAAAFLAVGPLGWPLPLVFAVLAPLSLLLAWSVRR
jgi:chromate transporter